MVLFSIWVGVVAGILAIIASILTIWDWIAKRIEAWKAKRPAPPTRNAHSKDGHLAH